MWLLVCSCCVCGSLKILMDGLIASGSPEEYVTAYSTYSQRLSPDPNVPFKGALCAQVKRLRVSYNQNDETLSRNSLRYLSKANLSIAVNCSCRAPLNLRAVTRAAGAGAICVICLL